MIKSFRTSTIKLKKNTTYYLILLVIISLCSLISYENLTFNLYFNSLYADYAKFFSTLDYSSFTYSNNTFPIWGYGLIHLLGQNILVTLILQQTFTFINLILLDRLILKYKLIDNINLFRLVVLLSSTWFLFHTQMWPKSIGSNLLLLGIILLIKYIKSSKNSMLIYSAICFGLLHNFRSEYIYLSVVIMILLLLWDKFNLKKLQFIFIQIIFLIPWMLFTYNQTGTPLLNSTNSGHVFFIGLGQLPNNIWGITPYDRDPKKQEVLVDKFGDKYKYIDYVEWNGIKEDRYLKKVFFDFIKKNPKEWVKKCLFASRLLVLDPFYVGNVGNFQQNKISNINEIREIEALFYSFNFSEISSLIKNTKWEINLKELFQLMVTLYTKVFGIIVFISFLIIFLISVLYNIFKRTFYNRLEQLLCLIILYQMSISIFAFHMPVYNSSIYIFYLLLSYLLFQKYLSIKQ